MSQAGLQFEQAPPISVPFRFFLSAPIFLVLAAGVLLWRGPEVLKSRLSLPALAVTHLFTLGFMSMVMAGALMQLLPVVAGASIARPRVIAAITHTGLSVGTLSLAAGFLFGASWLFKAGAIALGIGFAVFIGAGAVSLWQSHVKSDTTRAIRLAVLSLFMTIIFGIILAASFGWGSALLDGAIPELHPAWGLLGWAGLLTIGVAYQVVPMFQITPKYPVLMTKYLAVAALLLLALWSIALWLNNGVRSPLVVACALALAAGYTAFAAMTMVLQQRRRRHQPDVTLDFWRVGMGSLIGANAAWVLCLAWPQNLPSTVEVLIGLLALFGFAGSIISGMLYKIMPFLVWFHLQSMTGAGRIVPNMKQILGESDQRLQFRVHVAALALLLAAVAWPAMLVYPAAPALGAAGVLLEVNLLKVLFILRSNLETNKTLSAARLH